MRTSATNDLAVDTLLDDLKPADVVSEYERRRLSEVPDAVLVDAAAMVIGRPKAAEANSFVLHAPLELLARAELLRHCSPGERERARQRIVWEAATYAHAGERAPEPRGTEPATIEDAVARLTAAIAAGELDDAQLAGRWLGSNLHPNRLAAVVGDLIVPSLAAAAHGPIFLAFLPRIGPGAAGPMLGNLARELARHPDFRLTWIDDRPTATSGDLAASVAETPVLGVPGVTFIQPVMDQAERSGLAPELVGPALAGEPGRLGLELLRVSTESMLLDDPDHAPYGWSHCLTMPQAIVAIAPVLADPVRALAVAATHVVGFRAAIGSAPLRDLRDTDRPVPPPTDLQWVVDTAAVHPDAHLAKYTVACLDTARLDPAAADQHLSAAAHLARWWDALPLDDDPIC